MEIVVGDAEDEVEVGAAEGVEDVLVGVVDSHSGDSV